MDLKEFFAAHDKVALGFSGGVDSAYLLYAATRYKAEVGAYFIKSEFQPAFELEDARRLAEELGVELRVIEHSALEEPLVVENGPRRCYYCKTALFGLLRRRALEDGFPVLLDGTNASDDAGDRPGMQALKELEVLSPLRLCGLTKSRVRQLSREAGLFTHDKPAYACLATRIPTGTPITPEDLQKVERAESALFRLGFTDFRVRVLPCGAKLQLPAGQMARLLEGRQPVLEELAPLFGTVMLDLTAR